MTTAIVITVVAIFIVLAVLSERARKRGNRRRAYRIHLGTSWACAALVSFSLIGSQWIETHDWSDLILRAWLVLTLLGVGANISRERRALRVETARAKATEEPS